ncbi:MAG TPA: DNA methyltransferase, partial [Verrucomicrobiae bacterium]|nr:DNA methyltransferase [Verrucomicrobiae bacterium]
MNSAISANHVSRVPFSEQLLHFSEFGQPTRQINTSFQRDGAGTGEVPAFINEFWTAKQRQAHSLHEVSYRACFKPQLPRFFIERLTRPGDAVYDPFMGRGTTVIEAALLGRIPFGCDINPLSIVLSQPRLKPPRLGEIHTRLEEIDFSARNQCPEELLVFYHPETLGEILAIKEYLLHRQKHNALDDVDQWIRMIAVNRLTGHSPGFFSVYTLPPN